MSNTTQPKWCATRKRMLFSHSCPRMDNPNTRSMSTAPTILPQPITARQMRLRQLGEMTTVRQHARSLKKHLLTTKNAKISTTMWRKRRKLRCAKIWCILGNANLAKTVVLLTTPGSFKRKSTFQATTWRNSASNSMIRKLAVATMAKGASFCTQSTIAESQWDIWKVSTRVPVSPCFAQSKSAKPRAPILFGSTSWRARGVEPPRPDLAVSRRSTTKRSSRSSSRSKRPRNNKWMTRNELADHLPKTPLIINIGNNSQHTEYRPKRQNLIKY